MFQDDHVVPYSLGERLVKAARSSRRPESKPVIFVPFQEELGYAHIFIHQAPELGEIVGTFVNKTIADAWEKKDYDDAGEDP